MIKECPICSGVLSREGVCPSCGYRESLDYTVYPTLGTVPAYSVSIRERCRKQNDRTAVSEEKFNELVQEVERLKKEMEAMKSILMSLKTGTPAQRQTQTQAEASRPVQEKAPASALRNREPGELWYFGKMGETPIPWRVLEKQDDRVLVLSEYGLAETNSDPESVPWREHCLNRMLNGGISLSRWFSNKEREKIEPVAVDGSPCRLFLLNASEAKQYMDLEKDRICMGELTGMSRGTAKAWWLRNGSVRRNGSAAVHSTGMINIMGIDPKKETALLRPAMWVDIDA